MKQPKGNTSATIQKEIKELVAPYHLDTSMIGIVLFIGLLIGLLILRLLSGKRVTADGYVLRRSKSGHDQYEHRAIAEEILGRRLEKWEVVHHINGRRSDNRHSNLCVMDRRDHDRYHEWYDWIFKTYGNNPRRETQLQKLRESFNGQLLAEFVQKRTGAG